MFEGPNKQHPIYVEWKAWKRREPKDNQQPISGKLVTEAIASIERIAKVTWKTNPQIVDNMQMMLDDEETTL